MRRRLSWQGRFHELPAPAGAPRGAGGGCPLEHGRRLHQVGVARCVRRHALALVAGGGTIALVTRVVPWRHLRGGQLDLGASPSAKTSCSCYSSRRPRSPPPRTRSSLQYTAPLYVLVLGRFLLDEPPSRAMPSAGRRVRGDGRCFFVGRLEAMNLAGNACAVLSGMGFGLFLTSCGRSDCTHETPRPRWCSATGCSWCSRSRSRSCAAMATCSARIEDMAGLLFWASSRSAWPTCSSVRDCACAVRLEASLIGMLEPVLNPVWVTALPRRAAGLVGRHRRRRDHRRGGGCRTWVSERQRSGRRRG